MRLVGTTQVLSGGVAEGLFDSSPAFRICLAVAVVALRQPRRVQRRNGSHGPLGLREAFAPLDAALLVAARRVLPRFQGTARAMAVASFLASARARCVGC